MNEPVSLDLAFRNVGICYWKKKNTVYIPTKLAIIKTPARKNKQNITKTDFADCAIFATRLRLAITDRMPVIFELSGGSKSNRASRLTGYAIGVVATFNDTVPITPMEAKKAMGNSKAKKPEIIKWAIEKYPKLNWADFNKGDLEHIADAIAIGLAYFIKQ